MRRMAQATLLLASAALAPALGAQDGPVTASMVPVGWELGETQRFVADNLFEQINGAAPGYLRYSFRVLTVQPVRRTEDPRSELLVEAFEFGHHLDAFGIYSTERAPGLDFVKLGAEGYQVSGGCRFYRGNHYVKIAATRNDDVTRLALGALASALARSLRGETRAPRLLRAFPRDGLIAASERYEGSDLLAHDFLGAGFTADYDVGGEKPAKLFLSIKPNATEAREAYYRLLSFLRRRSTMGESLRVAGGRGRMTDQPFYGPSLVCWSGSLVCGVLATPSREAAVDLVETLVGNLEAMGVPNGGSPGPCCPW